LDAEKTDEGKAKQADVELAEEKLAELDKRKKGALWAIQQDPADEDAQRMFRDAKRDIADMKTRNAGARSNSRLVPTMQT
jgi:hypothetical protein